MNMAKYVNKEEELIEMENKTELLKKVQSYNFAAHDMLLFLDTHPKDKSAFSLFRDLVDSAKKAIIEYEKAYGPLSAFSAATFESFEWLDSPWPWEKEANK